MIRYKPKTMARVKVRYYTFYKNSLKRLVFSCRMNSLMSGHDHKKTGS